MRAGKGLSGLRRLTGLGAVGCLAFALLAGGCVLAATAGPRQAQATQARALRQTVGSVSPLAGSIVVRSSFTSVFNAMSNAGFPFQELAPADFDDVTAQLRRDFNQPPLRMAPPSADWWDMTSSLYSVVSPPRSPVDHYPEQAEVVAASPAAGQQRLLAGRMPGPAAGPVKTKDQETYTFQVAVTRPTASAFGLRPGSRLTFDGLETQGQYPALLPVIKLDVTGIVAPAHPGAAFWQSDPLLPAPRLVPTETGTFLDGAFIADLGELGLLQQALGPGQLSFQWVLPIDLAGLSGQGQGLFDQVNQITNTTPALTGNLAPMGSALTASSGLLQPLAVFLQAMDGVADLLRILYVGLSVAGAVVLLLAARTIAARRSAELAVLRARGASLWQLFARGALGAAVACVPAAALAWVIAAVLFPGDAPAGLAAWWPGIATVVVAVAGPGAVAAWQQRLPRRSRARPRRWRWVPRVVIEVTVCAAAVGGIEIFRAQAGATGLYASAAPVLIAVPAVIVILRVYQWVVRGLARAAARQRGLTGFLGLTRAALASGTRVLPAMTLVLLLIMAAFTGMVRGAVTHGDTAVSWQETGADAVVTAPGAAGLSPAAVRAVTAVPGVQHAAAALLLPVELANAGQVVTAIAVDPAGYAALVGSTEGFAAVRPALLAQPPGQSAVPVLASPQAARAFRQPANDLIDAQQGLPALRVRVAGVLPSTPAVPAGGGFIVLPLSAIHGPSVPRVNLMLLTGPSIDVAKLRAAVHATVPGANAATVSVRSQALQELTQAPVQLGTFSLFTLALGYAAALALAVLLLELALSATDREVTLARLATMGLAEGQRVRLVVLELVPALAATAVAAVACAVALPRIVGQEINLSVFTQSQSSPPLRVDLASVLLPLAGLLVVAAVALAHEIRAGRGRGVAVTMRT
jgi:putative ABC transport system permease protein